MKLLADVTRLAWSHPDPVAPRHARRRCSCSPLQAAGQARRGQERAESLVQCSARSQTTARIDGLAAGRQDPCQLQRCGNAPHSRNLASSWMVCTTVPCLPLGVRVSWRQGVDNSYNTQEMARRSCQPLGWRGVQVKTVPSRHRKSLRRTSASLSQLLDQLALSPRSTRKLALSVVYFEHLPSVTSENIPHL